jgi:tRNA A-37 threonylcarbamoyl transferase component Bud32
MEDVVYEREGDLEVWRHRCGEEMLSEWFVPFLRGEAPVEPVKDSHSRKTYRWESPGGVVYVKAFLYTNPYTWKDVVRQYVSFKRQGLEQFKKIKHLYEIGVNVARPYLALEKRCSLLKRKGLVVMEAVEGRALKDALKKREVSTEAVFRQGLDHLKFMHENDIAFGDTRLNNLLLNERGDIYWIDYDQLKTNYRWWPSKLRDLRRYICSWLSLENRFKLEEIRKIFKEEYSLNFWLEDFLFYRIWKKSN